MPKTPVEEEKKVGLQQVQEEGLLHYKEMLEDFNIGKRQPTEYATIQVESAFEALLKREIASAFIAGVVEGEGGILKENQIIIDKLRKKPQSISFEIDGKRITYQAIKN